MGIDAIEPTSSFDLQSPACVGPIRRGRLLLLLDHSTLEVGFLDMSLTASEKLRYVNFSH